METVRWTVSTAVAFSAEKVNPASATAGLLQRVDELAYNEVVASGSPIDPGIFEYAEDNVNPFSWIAFTDEAWNTGVEQLKSLGVAELLKIYESAWARVK